MLTLGNNMKVNRQYYNSMAQIIIRNEDSLDKIFFTADTHFGHQRTLELSKRPFKTVEEMDLEIVRKIFLD